MVGLRDTSFWGSKDLVSVEHYQDLRRKLQLVPKIFPTLTHTFFSTLGFFYIKKPHLGPFCKYPYGFEFPKIFAKTDRSAVSVGYRTVSFTDTGAYANGLGMIIAGLGKILARGLNL
jgi:hypothetical protein